MQVSVEMLLSLCLEDQLPPLLSLKMGASFSVTALPSLWFPIPGRVGAQLYDVINYPQPAAAPLEASTSLPSMQ